MEVEQTLVLVKPDAVYMGYTDEIRRMLVDVGFVVVLDRPIIFSREDARWFYSDHEGKPYLYGLISAMSGDPSQVMVLRREGAIEKALELKKIIRETFKSAGGPYNVFHCSDGSVSYKKEFEVINRCLSR